MSQNNDEEITTRKLGGKQIRSNQCPCDSYRESESRKPGSAFRGQLRRIVGENCKRTGNYHPASGAEAIIGGILGTLIDTLVGQRALLQSQVEELSRQIEHFESLRDDFTHPANGDENP